MIGALRLRTVDEESVSFIVRGPSPAPPEQYDGMDDPRAVALMQARMDATLALSHEPTITLDALLERVARRAEDLFGTSGEDAGRVALAVVQVFAEHLEHRRPPPNEALRDESTALLMKIMEFQDQKNPALAAKQKRLLDILSGRTPPAQPIDD